MTAKEFDDFLQEEIKRAENIDEAIRAYTLLEMIADALSKVVQKSKLSLPKSVVLTTLIFSSNPFIDNFSLEVQKEIRFIYYSKVGPFLGSMVELGEIMGAGKEV